MKVKHHRSTYWRPYVEHNPPGYWGWYVPVTLANMRAGRHIRTAQQMLEQAEANIKILEAKMRVFYWVEHQGRAPGSGARWWRAFAPYLATFITLELFTAVYAIIRPSIDPHWAWIPVVVMYGTAISLLVWKGKVFS